MPTADATDAGHAASEVPMLKLDELPEAQVPPATSNRDHSPEQDDHYLSPTAENVEHDKPGVDDGSLPLDGEGYLPFYFLDTVEEPARPGEAETKNSCNWQSVTIHEAFMLKVHCP